MEPTPTKNIEITVLVVVGYFRQVLGTMRDVRLDLSSRRTARKRHQIRDEESFLSSPKGNTQRISTDFSM